jgi:hypothetical protein
MPYPTQHENFYKNRIFQLQQKLQQLTETYNHRLNEVTDWRTLIRRMPDGNGNGPDFPNRFPDGPDGNPRGFGRNDGTTDPNEIARREAARIAALAARLNEFATMSPAAIINAIATGGIEFAEYVAQNYGRIVQVGSSYQRLLPDGTLQMYGSNLTWVNINKPGFMSAFGPISSNGIVIPMNVYQGMGHGGISPGDITYRPYRPSGTTPHKSIIPYQGPDPNVVPPM